jgi:hypothetical protein
LTRDATQEFIDLIVSIFDDQALFITPSDHESGYSYSKTPESIQVDHLFREAVAPVFGPFVYEIPMLLFEYEKN